MTTGPLHVGASWWTGVLDMRRRLGGWTVAGAIGAGIETIDGTERHPVRTAELRAEGPAIETCT